MNSDDSWMLQPIPTEYNRSDFLNTPSRSEYLIYGAQQFFFTLIGYASALYASLSLGLGSIFLIADNLDTGTDFGGTLLLVSILFFGNLIFWISGLGVWKTAQWVNSLLMAIHDRATPPNDRSEHFLYHLLSGFDIEPVDEPEGNLRQDIDSVIWLFTLAGAFVIIVAIATIVPQIPFLDGLETVLKWSENSAESSNEIGAIGAAISVLLGRAMGLLTLSIFVFSDSADMIFIFIIGFVIPGIFLEPASENIVSAFHSVHYLIVKNNRPMKSAIVLVALNILYVIVFIYSMKKILS